MLWHDMAALTNRRRWQLRRVFLQRRDAYTLTEASRLTGKPRGELIRLIEQRHIDAQKLVDYLLSWETVASLACEGVQPEALFEALGEDAEGIVPPLLEIVDLHVRVPLYMVRVLEFLRQRKGHATLDAAVREELQDVVENERLVNPAMDEAIPGLREAALFPAGGER